MLNPNNGIPGHSSHKRWARDLQFFLKNLGAVFEAEGEIIRVHIGEIQVEVNAISASKFEITIIVPLPGYSNIEEVDKSIEAYNKAMQIVKMLNAKPVFELNDVLPEYPSLYIMVNGEDYNRLFEVFTHLIHNSKV